MNAERVRCKVSVSGSLISLSFPLSLSFSLSHSPLKKRRSARETQTRVRHVAKVVQHMVRDRKLRPLSKYTFPKKVVPEQSAAPGQQLLKIQLHELVVQNLGFHISSNGP